jgi:kynurenine formamidase
MAHRTIVDLSPVLDERIPMFPGLPAPRLTEQLSREASRSHYAGDTTFLIHRYELIGNSGTYLDTPFHRYDDGKDTAVLRLERTTDLPGVVLDVAGRVAEGERAVDRADVEGLDVADRALLVRTGWDARWPMPAYLDRNPYLTDGAAAWLVAAGVALVGIDTWNVDDTTDGRRPVHSRLLRAEIPIVENLRGLGGLPATGFRFFAAPLPIRGGSAVPVRAYAILLGD